MHQIVPDVYLLEGLRSNVYLLVSSAGLTLVDSSLRGEADRIVAQLQEKDYALSELRQIVLTHAHGDHVGNASELARRSGAQVLAHRDEVPYIEQTTPLPSHSLLQRLLISLGDRLLFRTAPCQVDEALEEWDVIEALGGMRVIHTPGHTPGSICLYQPERRILFCGDTLFNRNPMTGKEELQLPRSLVTVDVARMRESVRKLLAYPVDVLCFGHGEPILKGASERLAELPV
jgi:glyoxylase-like metal-dependent hydrolase (beta-lactamase superfamily II)